MSSSHPKPPPLAPTPVEKFLLFSVLFVVGLGVLLNHLNPDCFQNVYAAEEGLIEWLTVGALLFGGFLCVARRMRFRGQRTRLYLAMVGLMALMIFFGAGEELSWGQRLFAIESPEYILKHNSQLETTLHNLALGGRGLNTIVLSRWLGLGIVSYLLVLPFLQLPHLRTGPRLDGMNP